MRFRTSTAAACVLAAGLAAGGCASSSPGPSASPVSSPVITDSTAPATSTAPAVNGSPAAPVSDAPSTSAPSTSAPSTGAQAAGGSGICQAQDLHFALSGLAATPNYPGQKRQAVDLTNLGSGTCTLTGFPGVDLVGLARGQQNYSWSLVRQRVSYSRVTLPPGGTAHFDVIYLPEAAGDSGAISVAKIVITPPNDFTQAELTWKQPVVLQDEATHPGTYITPVVPGP
jgi:Protein of unknown function (DUF4232)